MSTEKNWDFLISLNIQHAGSATIFPLIFDVPPLVFSYLPPDPYSSVLTTMALYSQILSPFFFQILSNLPKVAFALPMRTFISLSQLLSTAITLPR